MERRWRERVFGFGRTGVRTRTCARGGAQNAARQSRCGVGPCDTRSQRAHLSAHATGRDFLLLAHKLDLHPQRRRPDMLPLVPPQPPRPGRRQPLHVKHQPGANRREQCRVREGLQDGAP